MGFYLIEKFSRKGVFIWVSFINVLCLLLFTIFAQLQMFMDTFKYGCVLALIVYGISYRYNFKFFIYLNFSFATGPIAWFITAELIPIDYRSYCQSIALSTNNLIAFFLTMICFPLYKQIGAYTFLILFVLPGFICLIILCKFLPETKGRDIQLIIKDLNNELTSVESSQNFNELRTKVFEKDIIS